MNKHILTTMAFLILTAAMSVYGQMEFGMAGPEVSHDLAFETSAVYPGDSLRGALRFRLSPGWHVNSHEPLDEYLIPTVLEMAEHPGFVFERVAYPEHEMFRFAFSPDALAVYGEEFVIGFVVQVAEDVAPGDYVLAAKFRYQACNDTLCAPPRDLSLEWPVTVAEAGTPVEEAVPEWFASVNWKSARSTPVPEGKPVAPAGPVTADLDGDWKALADRFVVTGSLAGFTNTRGFLSFLDSAAEGGVTEDAASGRRWWWLLGIVLGGGLLLNLTPCVLPLIPINIAIIGAGARAGSRSRGFALGAAYGLGIALVYGALGLVVVLGLSTAFGAINSTAWFNASIAVLFVVLGLAMFDIIAIDFSKYQAKIGFHGNGGGRFFIALGMGAVSALLAGACVAPVVIYTIIQAQDLYSQGNPFALALPFGLGAGMALPWPFLGAGLSLLPKPGKWMVRVKQAFGIFILGFALYYGHLAYTLAAPSRMQENADGIWTHSLEAGLARALEEGRPVIVDFWATWCKNCAVMDRTVLRDEEVLSRLENHVKIKYQAEMLTESPARDVVEYFQVMGLPTFIVMEPKG